MKLNNIFYIIEFIKHKLYTSERDNIKKMDINSIKKEVLDIVKRNTNRNIDDMNKKIVELFQMDENFKQIICNKE